MSPRIAAIVKMIQRFTLTFTHILIFGVHTLHSARLLGSDVTDVETFLPAHSTGNAFERSFAPN
jgi:hypothetical protein